MIGLSEVIGLFANDNHSHLNCQAEIRSGREGRDRMQDWPVFAWAGGDPDGKLRRDALDGVRWWRSKQILSTCRPAHCTSRSSLFAETIPPAACFPILALPRIDSA
jgi:hypothetical protein